MPTQSMTGIGQGETKSPKYSLKIELKSVNNRFKDYRFRLPQAFSSLEFELKKIIDQNFSRGTFDAHFNLKKISEQEAPPIDFKIINDFLNNFKQNLSLKDQITIQVNPVDFFRSEFQKSDDEDSNEVKQMILKLFQNVVISLKKSRLEEGEKLKQHILSHIDEFKKEHTNIKGLSLEFKTEMTAKIKEKFKNELGNVPIDQNRFHQEIVYYLERLDIDEEINRIKSHLQKLNDFINSEGEVGRKIDFIVQELNREVNTIGSKSSSQNITNSVVNMKVQLEKIREQALNLE